MGVQKLVGDLKGVQQVERLRPAGLSLEGNWRKVRRGFQDGKQSILADHLP